MGLSLSRPTHVWNSYCQALEKQPLITKSLTSVVGFALGDIVAQATTRSNLRRPKRFDVARTLRMATFGGMLLRLLAADAYARYSPWLTEGCKARTVPLSLLSS